MELGGDLQVHDEDKQAGEDSEAICTYGKERSRINVRAVHTAGVNNGIDSYETRICTLGWDEQYKIEEHGEEYLPGEEKAKIRLSTRPADGARRSVEGVERSSANDPSRASRSEERGQRRAPLDQYFLAESELHTRLAHNRCSCRWSLGASSILIPSTFRFQLVRITRWFQERADIDTSSSSVVCRRSLFYIFNGSCFLWQSSPLVLWLL